MFTIYIMDLYRPEDIQGDSPRGFEAEAPDLDRLIADLLRLARKGGFYGRGCLALIQDPHERFALVELFGDGLDRPLTMWPRIVRRIDGSPIQLRDGIPRRRG